MSSQNKEVKTVQLSRKTLVIFAVVIVLIIAACAFAFSIMSKRAAEQAIAMNASKTPGVDTSIVLGEAKEGSVSEKLEQMQKNANENSIGIEMNIEVVLENGDSEGNAMIGNPDTNTKSFVVSIILDDTKEEVYRSGLIPPNSYIDTIKLTKSLAKGKYPATAFYEVYNDAGEMTGKTGINLTITVLN